MTIKITPYILAVRKNLTNWEIIKINLPSGTSVWYHPFNRVQAPTVEDLTKTHPVMKQFTQMNWTLIPIEYFPRLSSQLRLHELIQDINKAFEGREEYLIKLTPWDLLHTLNDTELKEIAKCLDIQLS